MKTGAFSNKYRVSKIGPGESGSAPTGDIKWGRSKLVLGDPNYLRCYWDGKWKRYDVGGNLFRIVVLSKGRVKDFLKKSGTKQTGNRCERLVGSDKNLILEFLHKNLITRRFEKQKKSGEIFVADDHFVFQ